MPCSRTRERRKGARGRGTRSASVLGYGSGKDWKALSALNPSPVFISKKFKARAGRCTNEKNKTLCGSFCTLWPYCLEFAHARYDRTDEIDIEN